MFSVLAKLWSELQAASDRFSLLRDTVAKHARFVAAAKAAVGDVIPNSVPAQTSVDAAAALPGVCPSAFSQNFFFLPNCFPVLIDVAVDQSNNKLTDLTD